MEKAHESSGFDSWASVQIVIDLHRVMIVCGGARVEQRREQLGFGVFHLRAVLVNGVEHALNVISPQHPQAIPNIGGVKFGSAADPNSVALIQLDLYHDFNKLVQLLPVARFSDHIILNTLSNTLSYILSFHLHHRRKEGIRNEFFSNFFLFI